MKVKIGDTVYHANKEPILLILDEVDKENLANMHPEATYYICFPEDYDIEKINKFKTI